MKKSILILILVVLTCLTLFACKEEPTEDPGVDGTAVYKLSFCDGDAVLSAKDFQEGTAPENFAAPAKEGYDFIGWYSDKECLKPFTLPSAITSNITVYAKYSVKIFSISFVSESGTQTVKVNYGASATPPEVPAREGYRGEWESVDLTNVKSNLTVNAVYHKTVTISFVSGIDGEQTDKVVIDEGTDFDMEKLPSAKAVSGYTSQWEPFTPEGITADTVVRAVYTPVYYSVRFYSDKDGASFNQTTPGFRYGDVYGGSIPQVPVLYGYEVVWNAASLALLNAPITDNISVKAEFLPIDCELVFKYDDDTPDATRIVPFGTVATDVPPLSPIPPEYADTERYGNFRWNSLERNIDITEPVAGSATYTITHDEYVYFTLSLNPAEGTQPDGASFGEDSEFESGAALRLVKGTSVTPPQVNVPNGYGFLGWTEDIPLLAESDFTAYCTWIKYAYTITFPTVEGIVFSGGTGAVGYGEELTFTIVSFFDIVAVYANTGAISAASVDPPLDPEPEPLPEPDPIPDPDPSNPGTPDDPEPEPEPEPEPDPEPVERTWTYVIAMTNNVEITVVTANMPAYRYTFKEGKGEDAGTLSDRMISAGEAVVPPTIESDALRCEWLDENNNIVNFDGKTSASDTTYYLREIKETFTVTLYLSADTGTLGVTATYEHGNISGVNAPFPTPVPGGRLFDCWCYDELCTLPASESDVVKLGYDVTLYARYKDVGDYSANELIGVWISEDTILECFSTGLVRITEKSALRAYSLGEGTAIYGTTVSVDNDLFIFQGKTYRKVDDALMYLIDENVYVMDEFVAPSAYASATAWFYDAEKTEFFDKNSVDAKYVAEGRLRLYYVTTKSVVLEFNADGGIVFNEAGYQITTQNVTFGEDGMPATTIYSAVSDGKVFVGWTLSDGTWVNSAYLRWAEGGTFAVKAVYLNAENALPEGLTGTVYVKNSGTVYTLLTVYKEAGKTWSQERSFDTATLAVVDKPLAYGEASTAGYTLYSAPVPDEPSYYRVFDAGTEKEDPCKMIFGIGMVYIFSERPTPAVTDPDDPAYDPSAAVIARSGLGRFRYFVLGGEIFYYDRADTDATDKSALLQRLVPVGDPTEGWSVADMGLPADLDGRYSCSDGGQIIGYFTFDGNKVAAEYSDGQNTVTDYAAFAKVDGTEYIAYIVSDWGTSEMHFDISGTSVFFVVPSFDGSVPAQRYALVKIQ